LGIDHLNDKSSVVPFHFGPGRAVTVGQQQLNGSKLLIHVHLGILALACSNASQFLD
jgi:hypothetical protein